MEHGSRARVAESRKTSPFPSNPSHARLPLLSSFTVKLSIERKEQVCIDGRIPADAKILFAKVNRVKRSPTRKRRDWAGWKMEEDREVTRRRESFSLAPQLRENVKLLPFWRYNCFVSPSSLSLSFAASRHFASFSRVPPFNPSIKRFVPRLVIITSRLFYYR